MSKYSEMVALLEYVNSQKKEKTPRKTTPTEKDPLSEMIKMQQKFQQFQNWMKDQEKLNKKEEKKPKSLFGDVSAGDLTMILMSSFFLFGPLYYYYLTKMLLGH